MSVDVVDIRNFYATPLGQVVARALVTEARGRWGSVVGQSLLGLGYAPPVLEAFRDEAMRSLAFMPAEQGVIHWPPRGEPSSTTLVDESELPLPTGSIDRALVIHVIENTRHPVEVLSEVWRVLEPGGKLLLVVPNRGGWWARAERTPFGNGRPYSRQQLTRLLRDSQFSPTDWRMALHMPPSHRTTLVKLAPLFERIGNALSPPFAGVHVVEAVKQVYSPLPARGMREFAGRLAPALAPREAGPLSRGLRRG
jgi:SAM-dependent methyltransferase